MVCPRHYPDAFPNDHDLYVGTVGMANHPAAVAALEDADTMLSVGVQPSSYEAVVLGDRTADDTDITHLHSGRGEFPVTAASAVVGGDLSVTPQS